MGVGSYIIKSLSRLLENYNLNTFVYFHNITIGSLWYVKYHRFSNIIKNKPFLFIFYNIWKSVIFYISQWNDCNVVKINRCIYIN